MKITTSKPEYQILSDSKGRFKVQIKGSDAVVPNPHLPRYWSDLDLSGECVPTDLAANFQSIDEAEEFIEKLELAIQKRTDLFQLYTCTKWGNDLE